MRVFAIGDIHGYNKAFRALLKAIELRKSDKLILLGDYIDRGPDGKGVLDTILLLIDHGFDVTVLRGNHEQMLIDLYNGSSSEPIWLKNGGDKTLTSFSTTYFNRIPVNYIKFLESMPLYFELGNFIFVHAGLNCRVENPLQDDKSLLWIRDWEDDLDSTWLGDRQVIYGHTPKDIDTIKANLGTPLIGLDNGSYLNESGFGSICALEVNSSELFTIKT